MFEKTIPWVVIYWVFKYTGWIIDSCESAATVDQAEMPYVSVRSLQSFPPCAADSDVATFVWMPKGGNSATTPCLTNWCRIQTVSWTLPFPVHHVPGCAQMGNRVLKNKWNLQKISRAIGSFQHPVPLVVHRTWVGHIHQYWGWSFCQTITSMEFKEFQRGLCCIPWCLYPDRPGGVVVLLYHLAKHFLKASGSEV